MKNTKRHITVLVIILFISFVIYLYQNKEYVFVREDDYKNFVWYGTCKVLDLHYKKKPQKYSDIFSRFPKPKNWKIQKILSWDEIKFMQYPLEYFSKDIFADDWKCNQKWRESVYTKNSPWKDWKYSPESLKEKIKYNNYLWKKQNSEKIIQFFTTLAEWNPQILEYWDEDYIPWKFIKIITSKKYWSGLLLLVEKEEIAETSYRNAYITIDQNNLNMYLSPEILYFGIQDSSLLPPKFKNWKSTVSTEDCKKYLQSINHKDNKNILNLIKSWDQIAYCKEIYKDRTKNWLLSDEYVKNTFPIYKTFLHL